MMTELLAFTTAIVACDCVFLEQPAALERAPDYRQLPLICSVIEGFGIDWLVEVAGEILSTGSPRQTEQLMNIGIVNSSTTNSSVLTISNGTDMNATCIAFRRGSTDPLECPSRTSQVLFHGSPTAPLNLSITENGFGSLYVSWLHATIEGVADKFTLIATNLNDSNADPIVVTGIEDLHQTITIPDNSSCDMYSFQVTATNDAGSSGPSTTTGKFPSAVACDKDTSAETDMRNLTICRVGESTYSIRCSYLNGSDADKCQYIIVSVEEGVENTTVSSSDEVEVKNLRFIALLGSDLNVTAVFRENIASCYPNDESSIGAIVGGMVGVLVILVIGGSVILIYLHKKGCLKKPCSREEGP